jgi:two-component system nitrogen regulation response regulator GlnG
VVSRPTVLICEDDDVEQASLRHTLAALYDLHFFKEGASLLAAVRADQPSAVILDIALRQRREGLAILAELRSLCPDVPVLMHSANADYETIMHAMRRGATDYVAKDAPAGELQSQLALAIRRANTATYRCPDDGELVGTSDAIGQLRQMISRLRDFPGNVIILGESGVGKEVVVRQLRRSLPSGELEPWVDVDSATIQGNMAESMLFGHEKGAFTGADTRHTGLFEQANGGVIYFDEVANMSVDVQAKLLRVLQEKRVLRVGSSRSIPLSFRVVAATNRNLKHLSRRGAFRFDLLARLDVFSIEIPSLRMRRDDIAPLTRHFLRLHGGNDKTLSDATLALLLAYDWPGNVRELSNVVQQMLRVQLNPDQPIDAF